MQLSVKDIVYLSNDGGTPGDGFRLQQSAGHRKLAKTPSVRYNHCSGVLCIARMHAVVL